MAWPKGVARPYKTKLKMMGRRPESSDSYKGNKNAKKSGLVEAPPGYSKHPLYLTYYQMVNRCYNPNSQGYLNLANDIDSGVKVCERWMEKGGQGFLNFISDMGNRLDKSYFKRVNPDKDFGPENCEWGSR